MVPSEIPPDVRSFVDAHIRSIGHMECLALAVEEPEVWTVPALAARLYVPEEQVARIVRELVDAGILVHASDGARWDPTAAREPDLVDRAVRVYRERLIPMTRLIHGQVDAAHQISGAFRFRKE